MQTGTKQILLLAGALALTTVLYFAPKKLEKADTAAEPGMVSGLSFEGLLGQAKGQLKREELEPVNGLEKQLRVDSSNVELLDSLGKTWDRLQFPVVSAHYFEAIALKQPTEKNWINAGYRYFDSFRFSEDSLLRNMMVEKAIASYREVLKINPHNLDAKTDLGICYAEGTGNPMQGIMLLREVVTENPDHANAQFNLGVLSVRSGQLSKAVERFEKVLTLDPKNSRARFLLGRTLFGLGEKDKALANLRLIKKQENDPQIIAETDSLISQIHNP